MFSDELLNFFLNPLINTDAPGQWAACTCVPGSFLGLLGHMCEGPLAQVLQGWGRPQRCHFGWGSPQGSTLSCILPWRPLHLRSPGTSGSRVRPRPRFLGAWKAAALAPDPPQVTSLALCPGLSLGRHEERVALRLPGQDVCGARITRWLCEQGGRPLCLDFPTCEIWAVLTVRTGLLGESRS